MIISSIDDIAKSSRRSRHVHWDLSPGVFLLLMLPCVLRGHSQLCSTGHRLIPGWVPCLRAEHLVEGPRKASMHGGEEAGGFHMLPLVLHVSAHPVVLGEGLQ